MSISKPLTIARGKTLRLAIRWETAPMLSLPITGISVASGFPRLIIPSHGIPNGWRGYVVGVAAPLQINAKRNPPRLTDYLELTVIDSNTIELNGVLPVDEGGRAWSAYTSGGFLQCYTPVSLDGAAVRVKIKDKPGGTLLLSSLAADDPKDLIDVNVDNAAKTITIEIAAADTEDITWSNGVWEVEAEQPAGTVESLIAVSPVTVTDEVVTPSV